MQRQHFDPFDTVKYFWSTLGLPQIALESLDLPHDGEYYSSSFKVDHLAQSSIAFSALAAALYWSTRHQVPVPKVTVPLGHACTEFKSERLHVLNGKPAPSTWGTIGGLHKTADGYIKMHDIFPNHRTNALAILGLREDATREDVATKMLEWKSVELESEAFRRGAVIAALRSFEEWDQLPQSKAIGDFPILLKRITDTQPFIPPPPALKNDKCLRGVRVVEMSRVIAAPVAGKTLAAHGAEVIWVTSPTLPDLPDLDRDLGRGKRTVLLDIKRSDDKSKLLELIRTADVFIQGYRPGSLAKQGFSSEDLIRTNPNLIIASLSAYGPDGPWSENRGFDSLVQTCSGINVADAERYGADEVVRTLPCQAFDHGAGYLLAAGIMAALYKGRIEGGAYEVEVSLAGIMKYLRSLGQYPDKSGYGRQNFEGPKEVERYLETRMTGFGELKAVKHSASIEGLKTGWDIMPKPLGSDEPNSTKITPLVSYPYIFPSAHPFFNACVMTAISGASIHLWKGSFPMSSVPPTVHLGGISNPISVAARVLFFSLLSRMPYGACVAQVHVHLNRDDMFSTSLAMCLHSAETYAAFMGPTLPTNPSLRDI
ncbi:CoA-transferase family III [Lindgomyces ingoldianus]|uniref:CoA-transferase family III n=1 Tax=Lindgomyces ingoldianus TaxID=673940 RepID=A0ACB6QFR8_9PLEO|nr:CoA-transferase family III [Lindgomyces ingoldianus]KAF2465774.1 CoA-transferase family III [Lindgomyces ingoldianus]